jgi:hypothetical protein
MQEFNLTDSLQFIRVSEEVTKAMPAGTNFTMGFACAAIATTRLAGRLVRMRPLFKEMTASWSCIASYVAAVRRA